MKFDIYNFWSGRVQFTAEIDCAEDAPLSMKIGLAVKWAYTAGASLDCANLVGASLIGASLDGAHLVGASLDGARLDGAHLVGASLDGANLVGARLDGAHLVGASLDGASLDGASLVGANLFRTSLDGASLDGANLVSASLGDDHKLAIGNSLFVLGHPNGWPALTYLTDKGEQRIRVGCRDKAIAKARTYWSGKDNRREVLAAVDYAEAVGRARGWHEHAAETQVAE